MRIRIKAVIRQQKESGWQKDEILLTQRRQRLLAFRKNKIAVSAICRVLSPAHWAQLDHFTR
jgi:hypothetical protein